MVGRRGACARYACFGALIGAVAAAGCERLAGLNDLTDATQEGGSDASGSGGDEPGGGGARADNGQLPGGSGNGSGGSEMVGAPMTTPQPLETCTLAISAIDECILE